MATIGDLNQNANDDKQDDETDDVYKAISDDKK